MPHSLHRRELRLRVCEVARSEVEESRECQGIGQDEANKPGGKGARRDEGDGQGDACDERRAAEVQTHPEPAVQKLAFDVCDGVGVKSFLGFSGEARLWGNAMAGVFVSLLVVKPTYMLCCSAASVPCMTSSIFHHLRPIRPQRD